MKKTQYRYHLAKRVTLVSLLINILLGIGKIGIGMIGHSQALIADGVHSLSDLLTDMLVLFAARAGSHGPDQEHPYGHGRIETFFVILLALFLIVLGVGIAGDALLVVWHKKYTDIPDMAVLGMALVSILANEFLFRYTFHAGKRIHSNLLIANAWHHRGDAYSSLIVLIGAAGAMLGAYYLDAVAAIIVAGMIVKMGISMGWRSIRELVDTGMDEKLAKAITQLIDETDGVLAVHQMRSRSLAGRFYVDVHVQVAPTISVSEGHYISDKVYCQVREAFREVKDIIVHIDPEDDERMKPNDLLPTRGELMALLATRWQALPSFHKIVMIRLDYLSGKIYIQLLLPLAILPSLAEGEVLQSQYAQAVADLESIARVDLLLQVKLAD